MLCAKCHEREATVHMTVINGDKVTKRDLCEECAQPETSQQKGIELTRLLQLLQTGEFKPSMLIDEVMEQTARYPIDAYKFICEALECRFLSEAKETGGELKHDSARELLEVVRDSGLKRFGKRAKAALAGWKIFRTEDIGEIIFELSDVGLFAKQREDSKRDFQNGFNFDEVFPES